MMALKKIAGEVSEAPPPSVAPSQSQPFLPALSAFMAGLQEKMNAHYAANYSNLKPPVMEVQHGQRYVKVVRKGESVYAFIDKENGDVLKPASWKAPAKHARGNIFKPDNGLGCCGPYSVAYLR
jgi:hypothetical protein